MLAGAAANFECTLKSTLLWETHHVLIGQVGAVHLSDNPDALLYGQRSYRRAVGMD